MRIYHGLAGYTLEVDERELEWRKPIDVVRHHASKQWKVEADDLIVIASGGGTLGPEGAPGALDRGRDVFLFVRTDLDPKAEVPSERLLLDPGDSACSASSIQPPRGATEEDDLPGGPEFEAFRANIAEALGHLAEARPAALLAAQARARLEAQRLAAQAVLDNLAGQRATCRRSMSLFFQKYERVQEKFEQNLSKVEASMDALAGVSLHPALQDSGRECLADVVPRERILRFTASVQAERARLAQRLEKLKQQDAQAQTLSEQVADSLRLALQGDGVPAAASAIEEELRRAELEMLPALRNQVPHEGAEPSAILEEEKLSAGILEGLARACRGLTSLLSDLKAAWEQQCLSFLQRLREVSYIQSQVRHVERQAALLEEEVNVQRSYSEQLSHLQKMPQAYRRALCEIARRQQFRASYAAKAEQARSALAKMVEEENSRRRDFIHRYGRHLPTNLFEPLGSMAPPAVVDVPDFDSVLPDVGFASLREAGDPSSAASVGATGSSGASEGALATQATEAAAAIAAGQVGEAAAASASGQVGEGAAAAVGGQGGETAAPAAVASQTGQAATEPASGAAPSQA